MKDSNTMKATQKILPILLLLVLFAFGCGKNDENPVTPSANITFSTSPFECSFPLKKAGIKRIQFCHSRVSKATKKKDHPVLDGLYVFMERVILF